MDGPWLFPMASPVNVISIHQAGHLGQSWLQLPTLQHRWKHLMERKRWWIDGMGISVNWDVDNILYDNRKKRNQSYHVGFGLRETLWFFIMFALHFQEREERYTSFRTHHKSRHFFPATYAAKIYRLWAWDQQIGASMCRWKCLGSTSGSLKQLMSKHNSITCLQPHGKKSMDHSSVKQSSINFTLILESMCIKSKSKSKLVSTQIQINFKSNLNSF